MGSRVTVRIGVACIEGIVSAASFGLLVIGQRFSTTMLHLIQETESESNLVRFLLCIDFQLLRTQAHCTQASPATALQSENGTKRPKSLSMPKPLFLSAKAF